MFHPFGLQLTRKQTTLGKEMHLYQPIHPSEYILKLGKAEQRLFNGVNKGF